jgi:hypothetical protein
VLLVTFHGGGKKDDIDNVVAYDDNGNLLTTKALQNAPPMSELRAVTLVDSNLLWVLTGSAGKSEILAFNRIGNSIFEYQPPPVATYQPGSANPFSALLHPFDLVFDSEGHCYVSNQDTDVVSRYSTSSNFSPAPLPLALQTKGTFWPGTFVASVDPTVPRVANSDHVATIPPPAGLEDWPACPALSHCPKLVNSVRGLAWAGSALYVADEVAPAVKVYDVDGNLKSCTQLGTPPIGDNPPTGGPVHLLVINDQSGNQLLLVTNGTSQVYAAPLGATNAAALSLEPLANVNVKKASGLAFVPGGVLYVGSRTADKATNQNARIYKYTGVPEKPDTGSSFDVQVRDLPEFVLHAPDAP